MHHVLDGVPDLRLVKNLDSLSLVPIKRFRFGPLDEDDDDGAGESRIDSLNRICSNTLSRNHRHEVILLDQLKHDLGPSDELSVDV